MADAPAVHIRREYPAPPSLRQAIKRYLLLSQHSAVHGVDPGRELARRRLLSRGPVALSPIANADGPLQVGHVVIDKRRRVWRFRACDMATGRCVFQRFIEAETVDEARELGTARMTQEWDKVLQATDGHPPAALVGSAIAI